mmetsp:Transcript_15779/g.19225  ORF Transcript_15779/g.19225 Transcript_15779/m.19225 type:complete len:297 (+) Transcript_15779:41-931(+)
MIHGTFLSFLLPLLLIDGLFAFNLNIPVSSLLTKYASDIAILKEKAGDTKYFTNDVSFLRFRLANEDSDIEDVAVKFMETAKWRATSPIVSAAKVAVETALASENGWDNAPVRDAAPFASIVNEYITPSQILTTTSRAGDLVFCIRAGGIDDQALMSKIDSDQLVEFFLYCKEVNSIVADLRSAQTDRLVTVVVMNDLSGVKLLGDATFRNALSASSKQATDLYPALNGPTMLVNLPRLLGALVKLFTPLFPEAVRKKIKFERGPLQGVDDLQEILQGGSGREKLMDELDQLLYSS